MRRIWPGSSRPCCKGRAARRLIESYDIERIQAADENIGHSTRSTDFMSPHSRAERRLRDAVLALAPSTPSSRAAWSIPAGCRCRRFTTRRCRRPTSAPFAGTAKLGAPLPDAPLRRADGTPTHLLENLRGEFEIIHVKNGDATMAEGAARSTASRSP